MRASSKRNQKSVPLLGITIGAILATNSSAAQQAAEQRSALEEIVITATRQVDTVNRVPLSITAQTQRNLDQQGIRTLSDLQAAAPALAVTQQTTPGTANVAIRGISDLGQGAPTTGFYLDDTALQKRNATGAFNGNGTPLPPLFDLERVEVLRGPQGTLFGGSSEGGTIRYITPQPSLDTYSAYARAEISKTKYAGDPSYEAGVAFGGPIIENKLGFRVSVFDRETAGYTDIVDRTTGLERFEDANEGSTRVFRGALAWQATDNLRATLAFLASEDKWDDTTTGYSPSTTSPIVSRPLCFNTPAAPTFNPAPVSCSGSYDYQRPGFTIAPYTLDPDQTIGTGPAGSSNQLLPTSTTLKVPTLTLDYDAGFMTVKSITSYIRDVTNVRAGGSYSQLRDATVDVSYGGLNISWFNQPVRGRGLQVLPLVPDVLFTDEVIEGRNSRLGWTQEVRFASAGDARPFSWVAGLYYSNIRNDEKFDLMYPNSEAIAQALYGITTLQRYGVPLWNDDIEAKRQSLDDIEKAVFAEANYWVTDKLRLTAGLRVSEVKFDFWESHWGPLHNFSVPTVANGGMVTGSVKETPVTPKVGVQYQITDNDMVYANASKGYRAGGANGGIPAGVCSVAFANFGLTIANMPVTYSSDSVWNYELGGKFRVLDDRVQINASVYRIDWTDPQLNISLGAGCPAFLGNAGKARSEGVELEVTALLFDGFTTNFGFGWTDARYTENAAAFPGSNPPYYAAFEDQKIAVSPFTAQVGARYDWQVNDSVRAYARADYRYLAHVEDTVQQVFSFGGVTNAAYAPDNLYPNTDRVNVRIGVEYGDFDINLFANNLFDNDKGVFSGGRTTCAGPAQGGTAACDTFSLYNFVGMVQRASAPRTVGLQVAYRY